MNEIQRFKVIRHRLKEACGSKYDERKSFFFCKPDIWTADRMVDFLQNLLLLHSIDLKLFSDCVEKNLGEPAFAASGGTVRIDPKTCDTETSYGKYCCFRFLETEKVLTMDIVLDAILDALAVRCPYCGANSWVTHEILPQCTVCGRCKKNQDLNL